MELFIQIRDGKPYQHPILGDNFRQAFPNIDPNNLPPEFARFERVERPSLVYATLNSQNPTYQWVDGVVKDVWDVTPFTEEQILAKQNEVKSNWAGLASWVFDVETCSFRPPAPYPNDGKRYRWDEATVSWISTE